MSMLGRMRQRFGDPGKHTGPAFADPAVQALRHAAADAQRSRLPQMAAALSYRTLFGLIPVLVVALLVVRALFPQERQDTLLKLILDRTGMSSIVLTDQAISGTADTAEARTTEYSTDEASADFMGPILPPEMGGPKRHHNRDPLMHGPRNIEEWLKILLTKAETTVSFRAIGLIGVATLFYAAIAMLVEIERAFNQVFRVPRGRSWLRRTMNYWALLTLGSLGLLATFYMGSKFETWADQVAQSRGWIIGSGPLTVHVIGYAVTVSISTIMLTLLYESVPNTRVRAVPAVIGAFLAALLWEAGKYGFAQYVTYSTGYAKIYGTLALVPLFLLWVYYTWLIVLFGLHITYHLQYGRAKTKAQPLLDFGPTVIEPSAGLLIMTAIARAMATGTPQSAQTLVQSTGLSEAVVSMVLSRFAERGLLHRIARDDGAIPDSETLYTLARTPGSIRVAEVLAIGFDLAGGPEANPVVARMRQAQIDAVGSETLADAAGLATEMPVKPPLPLAISVKPVQNPAMASDPIPVTPVVTGSGSQRPATL
jgi:membrane protein